MKKISTFFAVALMLFSVAIMATSCTGIRSKSHCQAHKIGNHPTK